MCWTIGATFFSHSHSLSYKLCAPFSFIRRMCYASRLWSLCVWLLLFCVKFLRLPTYTSQYWLRSYAIQFIWNMMDNDDGIEWQTHLVRPLVFMCTVYKCKHNHFVHTHAERGRWREGLVWLSATDYQSNLHIAWKWDDFCCRYCEQWTMAIAIYRVRKPSFAGKLQKVPISNETEKIERRHSQ